MSGSIPLSNIIFDFRKADGSLNAGGTLEFFENLTLTPKSIFNGYASSTQLANPLQLNAGGYEPGAWLGSGVYRIRLRETAPTFPSVLGAVVWTKDNVNISTASSVAQTGNAIANGSFEDGTDGTTAGAPINWTLTTYTGSTFLVDPVDASHGGFSAKCTSTGSGGATLVTNSFTAVGNNEVVVWKLRTKSTVADVRNIVSIAWYTLAQVLISTTSLIDDSTTNPTVWTVKSGTTTAPANAAFYKVTLVGCSPSDPTQGSTWFDGVEFGNLPRQETNNIWDGTQSFNGLVTFPAGLGPIDLQNIGLSASVSANALTIALKTKALVNPSVTSPVVISFADSAVNNITGDFATLSITAATSLVISSGSTMGTASGVPSRLWIVGFNHAGVFRLGAVNCSDSDGLRIYPLTDDSLRSSTAEGGAGAADSAGVIYTGTSVTLQSFRVLGYVESTQATAGIWATTPNVLRLWQPGNKLPGDIVQTIQTGNGTLVSTASIIPQDNTIPQITEGAQVLTGSITPIGRANVLDIDFNSVMSCDTTAPINVALFVDSTANAIGAVGANVSTGVTSVCVPLKHRRRSGGVASTTFSIRIGGTVGNTVSINSVSGTVSVFGGVCATSLNITELMG